MSDLEIGQYYHDRVNNAWLIFKEKDIHGYWFVEIQDENYNPCSHWVCYYEEELENLWRY